MDFPPGGIPLSENGIPSGVGDGLHSNGPAARSARLRPGGIPRDANGVPLYANVAAKFTDRSGELGGGTYRRVMRIP